MANAVNVNFRMDSELNKMTSEHQIPFDVSADSFYSEANIKYLEGIINDIQAGKAHFAEHELLEDED